MAIASEHAPQYIRCNNCGAEIPNDSAFCPNCGNAIKGKRATNNFHIKNLSLNSILIIIATGIWLLVLQNFGIIPVTQNVCVKNTVDVKGNGGYVDVSGSNVDVSGSRVDISGNVDVSGSTVSLE